jgi:hypothetical protein
VWCAQQLAEVAMQSLVDFSKGHGTEVVMRVCPNNVILTEPKHPHDVQGQSH